MTNPIVDQEKWNAIVADAKAKADKWTADLKERGVSHTIRVAEEQTPTYNVLVVEYLYDRRAERKALARVVSTGELRPATVTVSKTRITYMTKVVAPKAWAKLGDELPDAIVKKTKLMDFFVVASAQMEPGSVKITTTPLPSDNVQE
jgi:hypothetical protein